MNVVCSLIFLKTYEYSKLVEDIIKIIARLGVAADASTLIPIVSNFGVGDFLHARKDIGKNSTNTKQILWIMI